MVVTTATRACLTPEEEDEKDSYLAPISEIREALGFLAEYRAESIFNTYQSVKTADGVYTSGKVLGCMWHLANMLVISKKEDALFPELSCHYW